MDRANGLPVTAGVLQQGSLACCSNRASTAMCNGSTQHSPRALAGHKIGLDAPAENLQPASPFP